jgi:hypothetical protein
MSPGRLAPQTYRYVTKRSSDEEPRGRLREPFLLKGIDRILPPRDYRVVTDEELIEGVSFPIYRPRGPGSAFGNVVVSKASLAFRAGGHGLDCVILTPR